MSPISNNTQELDISINPIDFRVDMLRIIFQIESNLESRLLKSLGKRIPIKEFKKMFITPTNYTKFKKWFKGKNSEKSIFNKNKNGNYCNIYNFITNNTFGSLHQLISLLKIDVFKEHFNDLLKDYSWRTIKAWYNNIINVRNILAHRARIDPNTFFEKTGIPVKPKQNSEFNSLSDVGKKKFVIKYLYQKTGQIDEKDTSIISKFLV